MSAKHELQISGGITIPPGLAGSAAYSPVSHLAMQIYGFIGPESSKYGQGMVGYYWKNVQKLNVEAYLGVANGEGKAMNASGGPSMTGDYSIYFTQFNFGQNKFGNKKLDYGIGIKLGVINVRVTDNGYYEQNSLDPVIYNNRYYLIEPMAFLRIGEKHFRIGFQLNGASLINAKEKQKQIPYHPLSFGVSFTYILSKGKISEK